MTRDTVDYIEISSTISEFTTLPTVTITVPYPNVIVPYYANGTTMLNATDFGKLKTDTTNQFVRSLRSFYNNSLPDSTPVTLYYDNNNVSNFNLTTGVNEITIKRNVIVKANINTEVEIGGVNYSCTANENCTIQLSVYTDTEGTIRADDYEEQKFNISSYFMTYVETTMRKYIHL